MGRLNISFKVVNQKTKQLKQQIDKTFANDILPAYDGIQINVEQSCGKGIDMIKEALDKEKRTVIEVRAFMEELLEFIQESSDAFKHTDNNFEEVFKRFV